MLLRYVSVLGSNEAHDSCCVCVYNLTTPFFYYLPFFYYVVIRKNLERKRVFVIDES